MEEPLVLISLTELLNSQTVLLQKEAADKTTLESISNPNVEALRASVFQWATAGFPTHYPIQTIEIYTPNICSDGVSRNIADYITFCSGKSLQEHIALLQAKLEGMRIDFSCSGATIALLISKVPAA